MESSRRVSRRYGLRRIFARYTATRFSVSAVWRRSEDAAQRVEAPQAGTVTLRSIIDAATPDHPLMSPWLAVGGLVRGGPHPCWRHGGPLGSSLSHGCSRHIDADTRSPTTIVAVTRCLRRPPCPCRRPVAATTLARPCRRTCRATRRGRGGFPWRRCEPFIECRGPHGAAGLRQQETRCGGLHAGWRFFSCSGRGSIRPRGVGSGLGRPTALRTTARSTICRPKEYTCPRPPPS